MRTYFVWMRNKRDRQDDNVLKVKAESKKDAEKLCEDYRPSKFFPLKAYTIDQFKKHDMWWYRTMQKADYYE